MFRRLCQNEKFTPPADGHNTTGEYNPAFHSEDGVNGVSLPGYPLPSAQLVLDSLNEEFPYTEDYNGGSPIGFGKFNGSSSCNSI